MAFHFRFDDDNKLIIRSAIINIGKVLNFEVISDKLKGHNHLWST
jgi:hypothetical protein